MDVCPVCLVARAIFHIYIIRRLLTRKMLHIYTAYKLQIFCIHICIYIYNETKKIDIKTYLPYFKNAYICVCILCACVHE